MKYNLALTPVSKNREITTLAQQFREIADGYLLGSDSFPHVTLYQFHANENELNILWQQACDALKNTTIFLTLHEWSCITFDDVIFWVSLLPDQTDLLKKLHSMVSNILHLPVKKNFDPHLTLFNTKLPVSSVSPSITDEFVLTLGAADEVGQLTQIIFRK